MENKSRHPWFFIPTLYFAEGLPYIIINSVSSVVYTKLGIPKDVMTFWTGFLYLPWILKMVWSPLLENRSKKFILSSAQFLLAIIFLLTGLAFNLNNFFVASLLGFAAGAFISATYDAATDGYYMLVLDKERQSFYVGIRTFFYRLSMIFGSGIIVMLAGRLEVKTGNIAPAWTISFTAVAAVFFIFTIWHFFILPRDAKPPSSLRCDATAPKAAQNFKEVFKTYFTQKNILIILIFILVYRLGEASLEKLIAPFMLDPKSAGGLAVSTETFGFIKGTVAMIALIAGNILGGIALAKYGFKKCLWPFVVLLNAPNIFYVIMAVFKPALWIVAVLVSFEQFGYGLGFMAFTVFVMKISQKSKYPTSYYAISTGIMALGMMIPNMMSGRLQVSVGYTNFFIIACILSIPSFFIAPYAIKIFEDK
ncbi:MAG: MFS transporter [Elusimicrobium sp.]|jgi:PAT family beta-lactamase induction signal transducer AmpG|nr:MFS transporter [Elusimicrobium sp.]